MEIPPNEENSEEAWKARNGESQGTQGIPGDTALTSHNFRRNSIALANRTASASFLTSARRAGQPRAVSPVWFSDSAKIRKQKLAEEVATVTTTPVDVPMPPEFAALGRLPEPALARIHEISPDRAVQDEAEILIVRLKADLAAEEDQLRNSAQAAR